MHTIKVTRTGNSLDQEFEMESPDISIGDNYIAIRSMKNMSHKHKNLEITSLITLTTSFN